MGEKYERDYFGKIRISKSTIRKTGGAVVAFSGGVDSTFLLKVAHDILGDKVLAVTANSETYPKRELSGYKTGSMNYTLTEEEKSVESK
jgi:uncharacterized protein